MNVFYQGRQVFVTVHAIKRARQRQIAFPDQVYYTIKTGKARRFGENYIRFTKRTPNGSIVRIGEFAGQQILIKTVEKGK